MLTDEDIEKCREKAVASYKRHYHSTRGQQVTDADDPEMHLIWEVIAACEAKLREQDHAALPFAILDEEMKDLHRFHECASDGEGYDVPKERMKRLAEIGLLRQVTANIYEHTTFGLSVIYGDFTYYPAPIPEGVTK